MKRVSTPVAPRPQRKHPSFRIHRTAWRRWEFSRVPGRLEEVLEVAFQLPDHAVRRTPKLRELDVWELWCEVHGHRLLISGTWSATQGWQTVYYVHDLGAAR